MGRRGDLDFNDMVAKSSASATYATLQDVQTWLCFLERAILCEINVSLNNVVYCIKQDYASLNFRVKSIRYVLNCTAEPIHECQDAAWSGKIPECERCPSLLTSSSLGWRLQRYDNSEPFGSNPELRASKGAPKSPTLITESIVFANTTQRGLKGEGGMEANISKCIPLVVLQNKKYVRG